jgi:hypothetical protein
MPERLAHHLSEIGFQLALHKEVDASSGCLSDRKRLPKVS